MKIGILSDIHSNSFALEAVLKEAEIEKISHFFILGDIFGYYPWAAETYQLISRLDAITICGNHDLMLLSDQVPNPAPDYWETLVHNKNLLNQKCPEALVWLKKLEPYLLNYKIEEINFSLYHGTPDNPVNGRFYPDNENLYEWFPSQSNNVILLGHTHYPFYKKIVNGGAVINPGSVGQPRDGKISASWAIYNTETQECQLRRTEYNVKPLTEYLQQINWNKRAIMALNKDYTGTLKT
jgi:putative phosphoesterase